MKDFRSIEEALKYLYEAEKELLEALVFEEITIKEAHIIVGSLIQISSQIISLKILDGKF